MRRTTNACWRFNGGRIWQRMRLIGRLGGIIEHLGGKPWAVHGLVNITALLEAAYWIFMGCPLGAVGQGIRYVGKTGGGPVWKKTVAALTQTNKLLPVA